MHVPVNKFGSRHNDLKDDRVCNVLYAKLCYVNMQLYMFAWHFTSEAEMDQNMSLHNKLQYYSHEHHVIFNRNAHSIDRHSKQHVYQFYCLLHISASFSLKSPYCKKV